MGLPVRSPICFYMTHIPVLSGEALEGLRIRHGATILDATVGSGGHSQFIAARVGSTGRVLAMDRDPQALQSAQGVLGPWRDRMVWLSTNFKEMDRALDEAGVAEVDGALFDLGISSLQLDDPARGFSFQREGPLDMRMNPQERTSTAADLIARLGEDELDDLFIRYGQERWSRRIARAIIRRRTSQPIRTTRQLAEVVAAAVPGRSRLDPATRVFQALRIEVNGELDAISKALPCVWKRLTAGGRLMVIAFHSLEDRIVKQQFRQWKHDRQAADWTPKPIRPSLRECQDNPRSRSARLRWIEKAGPP